MPASLQPQLVVFDLEGVLVDAGCQAPIAAILETFAQHRLMLTTAQVRPNLALPNYEQVRTLLEMPAVGEQFQIVHGRRWNEADALELAHDLIGKQLAAVGRHCELATGAADCLAELKNRRMALGTASHYPRAVAELLWNALEIEGCAADANVCIDDVPSGQPAPWMIFRLMQELDVFPPASVIKVGGTPTSAEAAANAGCWHITLGEDRTLSPVSLSVEIEQIAARLAKGERP